jgi:hypothetical protein
VLSTVHTRGSSVPREHLYREYCSLGKATFGRAYRLFQCFDYKYVNLMGFVVLKRNDIVACPVAACLVAVLCKELVSLPISGLLCVSVYDRL